jgi:hypothetical protein
VHDNLSEFHSFNLAHATLEVAKVTGTHVSGAGKFLIDSQLHNGKLWRHKVLNSNREGSAMDVTSLIHGCGIFKTHCTTGVWLYRSNAKGKRKDQNYA